MFLLQRYHIFLFLLWNSLHGSKRFIDFKNLFFSLFDLPLVIVSLIFHYVCNALPQFLVNLLLLVTKFQTQFLIGLVLDEELLTISR